MTRNGLERLALIILAAGIVTVCLVHLSAPVGPFDDAFITFRYVDNVVAGRGAVYNTGERVFGVSCPLYALGLTLLQLVFQSVPLPLLAVRINMILLCATMILVFLYLRRLGLSALIGALAATAVGLTAGIMRPSLGAMETPMFLALLLGTLLTCHQGRGATAVTLASLASLTRPEGVILVGIALAASLTRPVASRENLRMLSGLAPLAIWVVAATLYFGTPVPHSVLAKARPLYPLPAGTAFLFLLEEAGRWVITGPALIGVTLGRWLGVLARSVNPVTPLVCRIAGVCLAIWLAWRWSRPGPQRRTIATMALPIYTAGITGFYAVSNPLLLAWYLPLVQAPVLVAAAGPSTRSDGPGRDRAWRRWVVPLLMLTTAAASSLNQVFLSPSSMLRHGASSRSSPTYSYARTASWIETNSLPTESVAAPEIGVLGYMLDRRILDACGLVTPEALAYLPVPPGQRGSRLGPISVEFVRATRPDLVVTLPAFADRSLLVSQWFQQEYKLVHEEPFLEKDPIYRAVLVFRRRDTLPALDG